MLQSRYENQGGWPNKACICSSDDSADFTESEMPYLHVISWRNLPRLAIKRIETASKRHLSLHHTIYSRYALSSIRTRSHSIWYNLPWSCLLSRFVRCRFRSLSSIMDRLKYWDMCWALRAPLDTVRKRSSSFAKQYRSADTEFRH